MATQEPIDLAHEPDFTIGRIGVSPVRREIFLEDGRREVVEHKVMQVLIALAHAEGAVVTRDELIQSCWQGRVVGDDAINRVISRLRKAADGIGKGSFKVETVTRIGYRLTNGNGEAYASPSPVVSRMSRRALVGRIGGVLGVGAVAGAAMLWRSDRAKPLSPEVKQLLDQARIATQQNTREGQNQAIGLYRRVTELAPGYADGWGLLALTYACQAPNQPDSEIAEIRERAIVAAGHAQDIDPENVYAELALATNGPSVGRWLPFERAFRQALSKTPDDEFINGWFGGFLGGVGRFDEALTMFERIKGGPQTPDQYFQIIQTLWGARRFDDLDRILRKATAIYSTQFAIWFSRLYIQLHGGKPEGALAMLEDKSGRPSGIPPDEFDTLGSVARAAISRRPDEIDAVMKAQVDLAHQGSGRAENAIQFACLYGRLDDAFTISRAYYFGTGFAVPSVRFSETQSSYAPITNRYTRFLFQPSTSPMRADPRFAVLMRDVGFERYWRETGVQPDYRRS